MSEITVVVEEPKPEVWSEASYSKECLLAAIRARIPVLEALRIKSRFACTEREKRQTLELEHELHRLKERLNQWQGFGVQIDPTLLFVQCISDMAGDADYDQQDLEEEIRLRLRNHRLAYYPLTDEVLTLLEDALLRIQAGTPTEDKFWDVSRIQPCLPDIRAQKIHDAVPAKTVTVQQSTSELEKPRLHESSTIAELEALLNNPNTPIDVEIRTRERLTYLFAAQMRGSDTAMLYQVKTSDGNVVLDAFERQQLNEQYAAAQKAVTECKSHERAKGIKCDCLTPWRSWYYGVQGRGQTPFSLAAQTLYDLVDSFSHEYERKKKPSEEVQMLVSALNEAREDNNQFPSWFGRRGEKKR